MPKTIDIDLTSNALMCLFKGRPKTRKSTAAGSFPGPLYFADCDGRIEVIKKEFPARNDIEFDTFTDLNSFIKRKNEFVKECPFKTIVFPDSLTFFVEMLMNYAIESRGGNAKTGAGKGHKSKGEISLLEIDDYGAETRLISELLDDLKIIRVKHKVNIIMTAHVMEKEIKNLKGEITETQQYLIAYGTKVVNKIPAAFNEVYHFSAEPAFDISESAKYVVKTQSVGKDFAGTALPGVPSEFDWTNEPSFYNKLMSYVKSLDKIDLLKSIL